MGGGGSYSILCFVKLASRAFQEYNNKSSGSTGNQSLPVRLLVRPVLERRNVVISQYLVILLETGKMSIEKW